MDASQGILTVRGGMTSHAAVVARGMGKCCVAGCGDISIDLKAKKFFVDDHVIKEGDFISIDGSTGEVFEGKIGTKSPEFTAEFEQLMKWADERARLHVHANADTPKDSDIARNFGAIGIGLCRTEHMFFGENRIDFVRGMILADSPEERKYPLEELKKNQIEDFKGILEVMQGFPVTIRLLDPPLHEFVPHDEKGQKEMAKVMGITLKEVKEKLEDLSEFNPMLGHRGCRLGNTYPEITEMQSRAIIEAALNLKKTQN